MAQSTARSRWRRRAITIPRWTVLSLAFLLATPLLLALGLTRDLVLRKPMPAVRIVLCVAAILVSEWMGLVALTWGWLRYRKDDAKLEGHTRRVQSWWAGILFDVLRKSFRLTFRIEPRSEGENETVLMPSAPVAELNLLLQGPQTPFVVLVRHTSVFDTLLPTILLTKGCGVPLRFVLKDELLVDPCFDIAGHRVPNHFVSRRTGGKGEVEQIRALGSTMAPDEAVVIYPEGTRFTEARRQRILAKFAESAPDRLSYATSLTKVLPPHHAGTSALLETGHDVLVLMHHGFDRVTRFRDVLDGALVHATIRVALRHVVASEVESVGHTAWIDKIWREVDAWVVQKSDEVA